MLAEQGYDVTCLYGDSSEEPPFYPLSARVSRINLWAPRTAYWYKAIDAPGSRYPNNKRRAPFDWLSKNPYLTWRLYAAARQSSPDDQVTGQQQP